MYVAVNTVYPGDEVAPAHRMLSNVAGFAARYAVARRIAHGWLASVNSVASQCPVENVLKALGLLIFSLRRRLATVKTVLGHEFRKLSAGKRKQNAFSLRVPLVIAEHVTQVGGTSFFAANWAGRKLICSETSATAAGSVLNIAMSGSRSPSASALAKITPDPRDSAFVLAGFHPINKRLKLLDDGKASDFLPNECFFHKYYYA
jgi:hypothetical protein